MKRILCAVDLSAFTPPTLACAETLAQSLQGELMVFHAVHFPQDGLYNTDAMLERPAKTRRLEERAETRIRRILAHTRIPWRLEIAPGEPVDQILGASRSSQTDMVVCASHGLSGVQRIVLGTVVERLARRLEVPLLVVRPLPADGRSAPSWRWPPERLLVGCPLRPEVDPTVETAVGLSRRLGARTHLVHAMASPLNPALVEPTEAPYAEAQERLQQRLGEQLRAQALDAASTDATLAPGTAGEVLCDLARRHSGSMMVVGVRPRGVWNKRVIGSTTEWVLRRAPCPVLVVPPFRSAARGPRHG